MIKAYTDIEQSRKLAKLLPLDNADCYWSYDNLQKFHRIEWFEDGYEKHSQLQENDVCAWSLAALLEAMPRPKLWKKEGKWYATAHPYCSFGCSSRGHDNQIDACVEILLNL